MTEPSTPSKWGSRAKKVWHLISTLLDIKELWVLFGLAGGGSVTAFALDARGAFVVCAIVAGAASGALIISGVLRQLQRRQYRKHPPAQTVDLFGGTTLTLVIHHEGLRCQVRARVKWREFEGHPAPEGLQVRPEPFDVHLQTRVHGGTYRQIAVDETFDMAKATLAAMTPLDGSTKYLSIYLPGMGDTGCVVQRGHPILIHLAVTVFVTNPFEPTTLNRAYRLYVTPEGIRVQEDPA